MLRNVFFAIFVLISVLERVENSVLKNEKNHLVKKRQTTQAFVCTSNECKYGTCEITSSNTYVCHCNSGITGTNCNYQAPSGNPCSSNPCYNGGTCTSTSATAYTCTCPPGIGGQQCTGTLNTCQCQNNGFCNQIVTSNVYTCACSSGYGGYLCQYQVSSFQSCNVVGCQNGGTCTIFSTCKCPTNYFGSLCQFSSLTTVMPVTIAPITICMNGICLNGGTCFQVTNNLGMCICKPGYSGIFCNVVGPATTTTTLASTTTTSTTSTTSSTTTTATTTTTKVFVPTTPGIPTTTTSTTTTSTTTTSTTTTSTTTTSTTTTSTTTTSTTTTTTSTTTTSTTTAAQFSNCPDNVQNPCQNGGVCTYSTSVGIKCKCANTYTGTFCETQVPFCSLSPCVNGGTCTQTDAINGSCACPTNYSGKNCEYGSVCTSNPCQNGSICITLYGVVKCLCLGQQQAPYCT